MKPIWQLISLRQAAKRCGEKADVSCQSLYDHSSAGLPGFRWLSALGGSRSEVI